MRLSAMAAIGQGTFAELERRYGPLIEPAFVRLRSVDPVLAEAAGDAFELGTDLFAALAKGLWKRGIRCVPVRVGIVDRTDWEVSLSACLSRIGVGGLRKKTANALLGAAKAVRSGRSAWSACRRPARRRGGGRLVFCGVWMYALPCAY